MRVLSAMMKHETNSFSPVRTDLDRFKSWGLHRGAAVQAAFRGTNLPIAAYFDLADTHGAELITPLATEAMPSGLVERDTYEQLVEWILDPIRKGGLDGIFLDLHGAMTAGHVEDGEGELLRRIRRIDPATPIAVTLDMHCNLTAAMVDNCDALIGYKCYPHTDMYAVGHQIGAVLWGKIEGRSNPVTAWSAAPILAQTLRMGTADQPMKALQDATRRLETRPEILAATVFGGFPLVDVPHAGISVVTVAESDSQAAETARDDLLDLTLRNREALIYRHRPIEQVLRQARDTDAAPIILLDHADNVGSGGSSDVMRVIEAVLAFGLDGVAVAALYDPASARAMHEAGAGADITLELGGKTDIPALGLKGRPLLLSGQVLTVADGKWVVEGPMYTGVQVNTGPTAVIAVGNTRIVVTSVHHEPWDTGILSNNGINPDECKYILLKSRIHYRAGFQPVQPDLSLHFPLDGEGATTSDNSALTYRKIRRPIYPLDPNGTYT